MLDPEKSTRQPLANLRPPITPSEAAQQPSTASKVVSQVGMKGGRKFAWQCTLVAAVGLAATTGWWAAAKVEQNHANWRFGNQAREATEASGADAMVFRAPDRDDAIVSSILLADAEADRQLTQAFRDTLHRNGKEAASGVVAQNSGPHSQLQETVRPSALWNWVADGRADFYRLHLADACVDDGDIVDVYVNHEFWATVTLANSGVNLSVPLSPGKNALTLVGKHDGGGGITVLLTTTEGHYFCRPIDTGEQVEVTAVRP